MPSTPSRRGFLTVLSLASVAGLVGAPSALAAEEALETTKVRFVKIPGICNAPQYVAEELLRDEGFTEISYVGLVAAGAPAVDAVARGNADFTVTFAAPIVIGIDGGAPVLRAVLKADDLCGAEPSRAAQRMIDRGLTSRYDYALQALSEIPYPKWREYDAEDTLRFYALRLHEAGMVKSTPQKIITEGTDWRFLDEVKRELKA